MTAVSESRAMRAAAPAPADTTPWNSHIGDPGPLGILAFSTTSFMLGLYNAHLVNQAGAALVVPVALVLGGIIQIIAAVLQGIRGNAFGATVFGIFGPFWVIYALINNTYGAKVAQAAAQTNTDPSTAVSSALTVFLTMYLVLTVIFLIAALRTDAVLVAVLALIAVALGLLAVGTHASRAGLIHASGWFTLTFAVLGWYHGLAHLVAGTYRRPVLPLLPLNDTLR